MARLIAEKADIVPLLAEVFRQYGFEGASLARIGEGTRLGKGSIYHFFPGGKEEMADAVLADIDAWFRDNIFIPLAENAEPRAGIARMFADVERYFDSGQRICLLGVFALGSERDRFAARVQAYFAAWIAALGAALQRSGHSALEASELAEETVAGIQGALVLSRALQTPASFSAALQRLQRRL
ncbi:TetR/AcrR family transcriptional regulator [Massilia sp. YIM B04103]|uniref:TetR/AcrR family transcriptional regulator n=1 Tax=Massilia sp. YIM B04103 TaxID=2963106 RepID=UPI00210D04FF|nr:TetR/AcrR family transcriptional regulator [Massilia sp. YIM B04103]